MEIRSKQQRAGALTQSSLRQNAAQQWIQHGTQAMDRAMQPFQWQPRATVAPANLVNQQRTNTQFGQPVSGQEPIRLGVQGRQLLNRGMMITNVARATIADEVGLEIGDVLVSVNGFRVQSYADIHAALTRGDGWATIRYLDRRTGRGTTRRVRIF